MGKYPECDGCRYMDALARVYTISDKNRNQEIIMFFYKAMSVAVAISFVVISIMAAVRFLFY